ncbi:hypothetical protein D3C81_2014720 [compost metagenome]
MVNRYGKSRTVIIGIVGYHGLQFKFCRTLLGNRHTNQSTSLSNHKIDDLWCRTFSKGYKIPFILTIFIIHYNDDFTAH